MFRANNKPYTVLVISGKAMNNSLDSQQCNNKRNAVQIKFPAFIGENHIGTQPAEAVEGEK